MPDTIVLFTETFISSLIIGIIIIGSFFSLVMFFKYKQRDSKAYFLLSLSAFLFVFFKLLSIYFYASLGNIAYAQKAMLFQDYVAISALFTLPYYLLRTFIQSKIDYKVLSWTAKIGGVLGILLFGAALIFPEQFIQFTDSSNITSYTELIFSSAALGPLFIIRDVYLFALSILAAILIVKKIVLQQSRKYSYIIGSGILLALYMGIIAIIKNHTDLPPFLTLGANHSSHFILGIGCFYVASLTTTTLQAVNKALDSRKLTLALQTSEQKLIRLAYHDPTTGILNRKSFYAQLDASLEIARRSAHPERRAVLVMDLDYFKEINDSYGHPVGDELIKQMVDRFQNSIRKSDMLFRLVGDEFALIVYNIESIESIALMAQKLLLALRNHFVIGNHNLYVSTSIGIAVFPEDGNDSKTLLRNADYALYEAKKDRNTFKFYTTEMQRKAYERMSIINALRASLHNKEFELYYQGLYSRTGDLAGAEALLRWKHPGWKTLPTDTVIHLAESSGLILELGDWILEQAFEQFSTLKPLSENFYLSINLSIKQLRDEHLLHTIEKLETAYKIDPGSIQFEITEGTFMENPEKIGAKLRMLTSRGYRFAVDDFGTGFSSFHYLQTMPVSSLKIDKTFLTGVGKSLSAKAMITSMIHMGHSMKMKITAEGVETAQQKDFLVDSDCDYLQGFYLNKPMPLERFITDFDLDS